MFSMNPQETAARIICSVDLDKQYLAWSKDHGFVSVTCFRQKLRARFNHPSSTDCDLQVVTEKLREFAATYQGPKKLQVEAQLKKMDAKLQRILSTNEQNVLPFEMIGKAPAEPLISPVGSQHPPKPNFLTELIELSRCTQLIAHEYLPFMPCDPKSCRVNWVLCPAKTRVDMSPIFATTTPYIHANTVSLGDGLNFIATIYPLDHTLFWAMALHKGNAIVDLTNNNDLSRNKVDPYYPSKLNEVCLFDERMRVECVKVSQITRTLLKYELVVTDVKTKQSRQIDRFHYTGWEDVSGTNEQELLEVICALQPYLAKEQVPIVHCMGGVGRTGTAIAGFGIAQAHSKGLLESNEALDLVKTYVLEGRKQRGPEFLQTEDQIETLWNLANLLGA